MSDWSVQYQTPQSPVITTLDGVTEFFASLEGTMVASTYPAVNTAYYCPIVIRSTFTASMMWVETGATANGTFDLGVYDQFGNKMVSVGGTNNISGTNSLQSLDLTDTLLYPGSYYLAFNYSTPTGTATFMAWTPAALLCRTTGIQTEAVGSVTLPSTATFASTTSAYFPFIGLGSRSFI